MKWPRQDLDYCTTEKEKGGYLQAIVVLVYLFVVYLMTLLVTQNISLYVVGWWVSNELERTWKGLVTSGTVPVLAWRQWGKSRKSRFRISNHRTEICTHDCTTYLFAKNRRLKTKELKFSQHVEPTPWCTVLLEKLIVAQLCKKYPFLCENQSSLQFLRLCLGFSKWLLTYVFKLQNFRCM